MKKLSLPILVTSLCLPLLSPGTLIMQEYFNYGGSNLAGVNPSNSSNSANYGTWSDGTNNVGYNTADGPTAFGGMGSAYVINDTFNPTAGGGILRTGVSAAGWRGVQSPIGATLSGNFWVSVLVNPTNLSYSLGASAVVAFNSSAYNSQNTNGPGFGFHTADGSLPNLSIFNTTSNSTVAQSTGTYALNNWYLILASITINADGNDSISLWAFSIDDVVPGTVAELGVPVTSSSDIDWGDSISNVWLGGARGSNGGSGNANSDIDALRISSAGGDAGLQQVLTAIPEPSTYATFLGLLALGCVALRRRRS
ncbi:MAG: PEP-CTERM sorting domain-containing protein [Verrucomicrobia bacterium]|nr:PEP-CTERM sorting domain-containing protein [Verrucomicrobiota bacterium]